MIEFYYKKSTNQKIKI